MNTLRQFAPSIEVYSVDESFLDFNGSFRLISEAKRPNIRQCLHRNWTVGRYKYLILFAPARLRLDPGVRSDPPYIPLAHIFNEYKVTPKRSIPGLLCQINFLYFRKMFL